MCNIICPVLHHYQPSSRPHIHPRQHNFLRIVACANLDFFLLSFLFGMQDISPSARSTPQVKSRRFLLSFIFILYLISSTTLLLFYSTFIFSSPFIYFILRKSFCLRRMFFHSVDHCDIE